MSSFSFLPLGVLAISCYPSSGLGLNLVYNLVTVALQVEIKALPISHGFALCCRLPNRWLAETPC